ncbi:glycosyltransferase [Labrenzia sp. PHM005]|uniref:glycosyltransferase family protein n=1 Tax=Labrenzia sp. PHM005 TaxID=2590016 RepID=UPI00143E025B|nr:glycosyltransferase [Labrenzia sp. PHM005]
MPKLETSEAAAADTKKSRVELAIELEKARADLSGMREQLAAAEAELKVKDAALSEKDVEVAARVKQLETVKAETDEWRGKATELKAELDAANIKYQRATQQETDLKATGHKQLSILKNGQLRWTHALLQLLEVFDLRPSDIAAACTKLAKERFTDDDFSTLLLSSIAHAAEPKPFREKWMGFNLLKSGLLEAAKEILVPLHGRINFSKSELRALDALLAFSSEKRLDQPDSQASAAKLVVDKPFIQLRMACIMDEFTHASFAPECQLQQLTPEAWEIEISEFTPDILFIESAWRGKDEKWGNKVGHLSSEVRDIISWCKSRGIPTVFWNKEDPVHFETFLTTAVQFDYVFTTDIDCIGRYKATLGHDRVYLLPFACQPNIHNPIEVYDRKDAFCFAGAYYVKYPERTRDLEEYIEELPSFRPVEIFDRNYGKDDPNYQFPVDYDPFIVGTLPFDQIDRAYKGYRYAINLNSIKQSQTMFARRVYELLASATLTVSSFSRGLRLLFGDLVISSDSGKEVLRRVQEIEESPSIARRFRLAGLRKVLLEHTYGNRLAYVVDKVGIKTTNELLPHVTVIGQARTATETKALLEHFKRQNYTAAKLVIVAEAAAVSAAEAIAGGRVKVLLQDAASMQTVGDAVGQTDYVASFTPDDYYGSNFLTDLMLATKYANADVYGKASYFTYKENEVFPPDIRSTYKVVSKLAVRCSIFRRGRIESAKLLDWVAGIQHKDVYGGTLFSIDEFNYCRMGATDDSAHTAIMELVDDLKDLRLGLPVSDLLRDAEQIPPLVSEQGDSTIIPGSEIATAHAPPKEGSVTWDVENSAWTITSTLADGKHTYIYQNREYSPADLITNGVLKLHFDVTPGLNLRWVILFLDHKKERFGHEIIPANRNEQIELPEGTTWLRFGVRVYGSGSANVRGLVLGERRPRPVEPIPQTDCLLVTNHYPSNDDLYRNGFVHKRVVAYRENGMNVDVFRFRPDVDTSFHEFENVDCMSGSARQLEVALSSGRYRRVVVHFLEPEMWNVLKKFIDRLRVIVWIHGSEIQPWWRRSYNFTDQKSLEAAKEQSSVRVAFWQEVLGDFPIGLHLVFVSSYFANEVMEDLEIKLKDYQYSIIHNPIDDSLFNYIEKDKEQRKRVLSIRPFASLKYANDLSVAAIKLLSEKEFFKEMTFQIVGDGVLFDETVKPLIGLRNVKIDKRFLTQSEIAQLHKRFGVFLNPTRMDAQGVSRDEAMSSGLVPVTSDVAAIPEFVDETCGFLAAPEDAAELASAIETLYYDSDRFLAMSEAAAKRVRKQSSVNRIVELELRLLKDSPPQDVDEAV